MKTKKIILYDEPTVPEIQLKRLEKFLTEFFPVKVEVRDNFFHDLDEKVFEKIAGLRILDLKKPFQIHQPTIEEILNEKENKDNSNEKNMPVYDGFELQKTIAEIMPTNEKNEGTLNIIFTNKLTGTFDENDFRYHARAIISSDPIIISTTGIIEAPAKPKQYYLDLLVNMPKNEINEKYKGDFLEYHDVRLSEVLEGYLLQAIIYYETGDPFCEHDYCRLYNAHWQKDLLYTQLENKKFCEKHQDIIKKMKN